MSAPSGKTVAAGSGQKTAAADDDTICRAIPTLPTPLAQALRHVHPALMLSLFYLRFGALVRDPVSTMLNSLPVVAALQVAYAVICLPAAGSPAAIQSAKKLRPGEKRKPVADGNAPNITSTVVVALGLSIFATVGLQTFFVLFGAPLLTHIPQTTLCSLHLSLLGLFPLFYTHGISTSDWLEVLGARAPFDEAFGGLVGGCVGAWAGAVPIPLDWDREWQKWPITILCGVYGGYVVGKFIGGTIAFGKKFGG
ncbi:GPI biosynthesis protein family Pig-F-domain-containing protein [Apiospora kogelbergensis]|uniref:GPI biosynthesis protein family Pig-F-domain-containing protein n=1 Tax=Apiospora kogelbergensis TaxID=1337665 RepID=A0AAW0QXT4_9PEZI